MIKSARLVQSEGANIKVEWLNRPRGRVIAATLLALHLLLVIYGATQIRLPDDGPVGWAFQHFVAWYGTLSGSSVGFGYFAPEIGSELRARFEVTGEEGGAVTDQLDGDVSRESSLRINNIFGLLGEAIQDVRMRQRLAASWAGKIFARHPGARQVTVRLETFRLPAMKEFRQDEGTGWDLYYRAVFQRKRLETEREQWP